MMFTTQMTQLFAVVLERDRANVTETLLREGVMQFISVSEFDAEGVDNLLIAKSDVSLTDVSDMRKRVEGVLHTINIIPSAPKETDLKTREPVDIVKEKNYLDNIDTQRESIRERQRSIQQEILRLEDLKRQIDLYGMDLSGMSLPAKQSILSMKTGRLSVSNSSKLEDELKGLPALSIPLAQENGSIHHLLISMKKDREKINGILSKVGWADIELPKEVMSARKDLFERLTSKLKTYTDEQKKLQGKVNDLLKKEEKHLMELWTSLRINELYYKVQANFKSSSRTVVFAGWLPSTKQKGLVDKITQACGGRCYLEWHEADSEEIIGEEVPVELKNPKILAPFQMLVSNFGVPQYGTIDPTPFVMPVYLIMFGLMFPDVGQGLVLTGLGALGAYMFKKNEKKKGMFNLSWLIIWCGLSAVLFGALFGSYFGMSLFKPLWFDFHGVVSGHGGGSSIINDIYDILAITVYFGITVILLGLIFNWINLIRTKRWMELVFDKGGVLGGWIYVGGIAIASYMISHSYKELPPGNTVFLLVGLPSILLFGKYLYFIFGSKGGHSDKESNTFVLFLNFLMEWIVELLEIFSGYLSNTLSFMRVAGLGIAHVSLMVSFFTLAGMTSGIFSVLILILGNILVIGLEGLSAGIQALRLNYYEFFTKFFHGTGKLYTPISLSSDM